MLIASKGNPMRLSTLLALSIGFALACSCSRGETAPTTPTDDTTLPDAIDVCVQVEGADAQPGRAVPSRAGVYDPHAPIDPTYLNWMVEGLGCVSYPHDGPPRVSCTRGAMRPLVTPVLCQQ